MSIPFWLIDAFASRAFAGNQAAVLLFDTFPDDEMLCAAAAENRLPATAFLAKDMSGVADYEICWFSPQGEIGLCGHATLAAGHAMLGNAGKACVSFRTRRAGVVEVRRQGEGYEMSLPAIATTPGSRPEAEALLGARPTEIWLSPDRYGIYLFESERQLRALSPDLAGLARLGNDQFICTAPGERTDIVSRVFVAGADCGEDSVTGSAHAALAPFWSRRLGRDQLRAHQASRRGGDLTLRLDKGAEAARVWLGGECVSVAEGRYYLWG